MTDQRICAYFGNRYMDVYERHMEEIASHGFNAILHPISEQDLEFDTGQVQKLIEVTKSAGFTCWVDPHCIGKNFGYGSLSRSTEPMSPEDPQFQKMIERWVSLVADTDWILWDEPNLGSESGGNSPMLSYLSGVMRETSTMGIKNSLVLYGGRVQNNYDRLTALMRLPHLDDVGVSFVPALLGDTEYIEDWLSTLFEINKSASRTSVWIPAYEIRQGQERLVYRVIRRAQEWSVPKVGVWGFRGSEAMFFGSARPSEVWEEVGLALTGGQVESLRV